MQDYFIKTAAGMVGFALALEVGASLSHGPEHPMFPYHGGGLWAAVTSTSISSVIVQPMSFVIPATFTDLDPEVVHIPPHRFGEAVLPSKGSEQPQSGDVFANAYDKKDRS